MSANINGAFFSEKPSKVRWKREKFTESQHFITGSWDNETNHVKLWACSPFSASNDPDLDYLDHMDDPDLPVLNPIILDDVDMNGEVTGLEFIDNESFVVGTSQGTLNVFQIENCQALKKLTDFSRLHYFHDNSPASCTAVAVNDNDAVTVGEDGKMNLLKVDQGKVIDTLADPDKSTLKCVTFLKYNETLTANLRGELRIWDIRTKNSRSLNAGNLENSANCLTCHPSQRHMVMVGGEDGSLIIWDLRKPDRPLSLLNAHSDTVMEVVFHPTQPEKMYSSSINGELWQWNSKADTKSLDRTEDNVWLSADLDKNKLQVLSLMDKLYQPINSIDINRDRILCGCDNEAVYVINLDATKTIF